METKFFDTFAREASTTDVPSLVGTFIESSVIAEVGTDRLLDAAAICHQRDVSWQYGVNINYIDSLFRLAARAPQLIISEEEILQSSIRPLPISQTGPYPIELRKHFTVAPPLTQGSGCKHLIDSGERAGAIVYLPEIMEYNTFKREINELIHTIFQVKNTLEMMVGEDLEEKRKEVMVLTATENLSKNTLWRRIYSSVQDNLTGLYNSEEDTVIEIFKIINNYWLPLLESTPTTAELVNDPLYASIINITAKITELGFDKITTTTTSESILERIKLETKLQEQLTRISSQLREFHPIIVGRLEQSTSNSVGPGQEVVISLASA